MNVFKVYVVLCVSGFFRFLIRSSASLRYQIVAPWSNIEGVMYMSPLPIVSDCWVSRKWRAFPSKQMPLEWCHTATTRFRFCFELFTWFHLFTMTLVTTRKMQMTFHGFPYENLAKVVTFAALITAAEKGQLWQDAIALVDSSNVEGSGGCRVWGWWSWQCNRSSVAVCPSYPALQAFGQTEFLVVPLSAHVRRPQMRVQDTYCSDIALKIPLSPKS